MSQIPVDKYNVCYNCGSVSGTDYSLNQSGLDSMREKIEIKEKEDKIKQDINEEVKRRILEHKKSTLAETVSKLDKNEDKLKLLADMYDKVLEAKNDITGKVFSEKLPDMRD
jgi:flagellar hook-basal body complex protein FliE